MKAHSSQRSTVSCRFHVNWQSTVFRHSNRKARYPKKLFIIAGYCSFLIILTIFQAGASDNKTKKKLSFPTSQGPVENKQWVEEKTGAYIPLDAVFKNEQGEPVTLQQLIDRPTLLIPVYYYCPKACSFDLVHLAEAILQTSHDYATFRVISMSFNEVEPPEAAAIAKPNYTEMLDLDFPKENWTFLTGDRENILKVTEAIGYTFKKQDDHTFIHPSAMVALSSDGKIIKYIYGSFLSGDVDLALAEAATGTPATSIRRFLSFCFNYSPKQNQALFKVLKFATLALITIGGMWFVLFLGRKRD